MPDTPAEVKLTLRCSGMCLVHCHDYAAWRDEKTALMLALSDPGHFTPRENRWPRRDESLTHWQMRAVRIIFQAREDELAMHDRVVAQARAEEREACAQLAEEHHAMRLQPCNDPACCGTLHTHHRVPFAGLIRARKDTP